MPHRHEARRFAPQVRSVFHFCYVRNPPDFNQVLFLKTCPNMFIYKYIAKPFFLHFSALQISFVRRKKRLVLAKRLSSKIVPQLASAVLRLQGFK